MSMPSSRPPSPQRPDALAGALLAGTIVLLAWSGYKPHDYLTWFLEVSPAVGGVIILGATYRRFPLTPLSYVLIAIHAAILIVGGHYTYARVPLGEWAREWFDFERNHYDRLGHFFQGFTPAIVAREVLLRTSSLRPGRWLFFIVLSICTAISGWYELLEWIIAEIDEGGSQAFLAMQGDVWDTQKDIALCSAGAVASLVLLTRLHDRQLRDRSCEARTASE
jgi:putative membrane protein